MSTRPIEGILNEARDLLREAEPHMTGGLWRNQFEGWVKDAADWTTSHPEGELSEVQLDPGVEARVSTLEQGVMSLAISVAGLQTLALQGMAAPKQPVVTRWTVAQELDPDGELEILDGTKVKIKDVPLDPATGMPEEEWAMKNCPCEVHNEKRRKAAAEGEKPADPPAATGMYL